MRSWGQGSPWTQHFVVSAQWSWPGGSAALLLCGNKQDGYKAKGPVSVQHAPTSPMRGCCCRILFFELCLSTSLNRQGSQGLAGPEKPVGQALGENLPPFLSEPFLRSSIPLLPGIKGCQPARRAVVLRTQPPQPACSVCK